ncbi:hypothetical protein ACF07O_34555 [Streptomyces althioticus]|uniref:hypothetical protein n=1 Tax=Streptomyces althioticus TaxID=83380 RepID=UPI0036F96A62
MKAAKLKCKDCSFQVNCERKGQKEKYEASMQTYCLMGESMYDYKPNGVDSDAE